MFLNIKQWARCPYIGLGVTNSVRYLSTTEISTALRPFYFAVHPDLFEQYPAERQVNENSLQQLSSYIEKLQTYKPAMPCTLEFYLREKSASFHQSHQNRFRLVHIKLKERNIKSTILTILKSCGIETSYVDKLAPPSTKPDPFTIKMSSSNFHDKPRTHDDFDFSKMDEDDPIFGPVARTMKAKIQHAKETQKLKQWLGQNYKDALEKSGRNESVRTDILKLKESLKECLRTVEILWNCGWNETHFRGCLLSLRYLAEHHPEHMQVLRGKTLVFGNFTGVSLDGHVMLNSGEVRHNWYDLIRNIAKHDVTLKRIPSFEKAVSQVLRDIKITRRKFMPKTLAGEYEKHLTMVTTALSDFRGRRSFPPSWPESLKDYKLVIESEAAPLMLSPTGQFIVPSSCPGSLMVNFITENLKEAATRINNYNKNKHIERSLHKQCIAELQLAELRKDDSVSPDVMIDSCKRLLEHKQNLEQLRGVHLNITTYYSVLSDGVVCIPWNWSI